jgi:hypothetical protein
MRHLSLFASKQEGFDAAAASRAAAEHRPPFMTWLAVAVGVAGVAICAVAILLF